MQFWRRPHFARGLPRRPDARLCGCPRASARLHLLMTVLTGPRVPLARGDPSSLPCAPGGRGEARAVVGPLFRLRCQVLQDVLYTTRTGLGLSLCEGYRPRIPSYACNWPWKRTCKLQRHLSWLLLITVLILSAYLPDKISSAPKWLDSVVSPFPLTTFHVSTS